MENDNNQYDNYEEENEIVNPFISDESPLGFCNWCDAALFSPEEIETGFCEGGVCEEKYHNHVEFE